MITMAVCLGFLRFWRENVTPALVLLSQTLQTRHHLSTNVMRFTITGVARHWVPGNQLQVTAGWAIIRIEIFIQLIHYLFPQQTLSQISRGEDVRGRMHPRIAAESCNHLRSEYHELPIQVAVRCRWKQASLLRNPETPGVA